MTTFIMLVCIAGIVYFEYTKLYHPPIKPYSWKPRGKKKTEGKT